MEKVKVTREVAEAIEFLKADDWSFSSVMNVLTGGGFSKVDGAVKLNTAPIETVAQAYLNGYEVEKSTEEKIRYHYEYSKANAESADYYVKYIGQAEVETIKFMLDTLGLKIEGVNA